MKPREGVPGVAVEAGEDIKSDMQRAKYQSLHSLGERYVATVVSEDSEQQKMVYDIV